ncbi:MULTISPECIES: RidA family protein [Actinomadura]|uniref:Enamine deaminase RidA, house cleaning of reactive enamine intermediates, YjgF/YER057c/UK114 family n=1 Tax=Actinomadura madurae TaxID=1993 RepID=A0A1I5JRW2_9ACTN|nr:RidA family protein [Actinomadura madurae]SFO75584.1 Enamine deaminase RidA, house cleaning of reactive enamine intermediates, YjgF/YER057c/UK114 family [Actinomadura madurae]SPT64243.1 Enamine/imine deaminase [Actinomadura madurae]
MSDHDPRTGIRQIDAPGLVPGPGYSHAVSVDVPGRLVVLSGQIALDAAGNLVGPGDLEAQTRQVFANLEAALTAAGARWEHVVRLGYFLRDAGGVGVVRAVRAEFVPEGVSPAASLVEVSRLVRDDLLVEIEAMAVVPAA